MDKWDKAVTIEFRKPGRGTLYSTFCLADGEIDAIKRDLDAVDKVERIYDVALSDADGVVHALFKKTVQVQKRKPKL